MNVVVHSLLTTLLGMGERSKMLVTNLLRVLLWYWPIRYWIDLSKKKKKKEMTGPQPVR